MGVLIASLMLMQVTASIPAKPLKSYDLCRHSYTFQCNDCWKCIHSARMKTCLKCFPNAGFGGKSNVCPYEFCKYPCSYHKKDNEAWKNIYSKETLSFSWIKNLTIKE
jgi:hypothetical protein